MATVNFLYRSTKDVASLTLRLLFRYEGKDSVLEAPTRLKVSKLYWKKKHNQKKSREITIRNQQIEINSELNNIKNHTLDAFNKSNPETIDKTWLKRQIDLYYNPKVNRAIPKNLIEYIDYYLALKKYTLKSPTTKKYKVLLKKLKRFQAFRNAQILIKEVDEQFKNEFITFFLSENYSKNTIQKDFSFVKTLCKNARLMGLEVHSQLDNLKVESEKVEKIYLTEADLKKIENKKGLSDYLDNARDWLIISCYTGQRVSDFLKFTSDMIREENKKLFLEFTQKKTGKQMMVPLHTKVLEILKKRDGNFPRPISDQKYNEYIKEVCEKAKINQKVWGSKKVEYPPKSGKFRNVKDNYEKHELVSSHIGRRSFATNFYGKIPTPLLMSATGHSTEKMFLNYIGKTQTDRAKALANYF